METICDYKNESGKPRGGGSTDAPRRYFSTRLGAAWLGDSLRFMQTRPRSRSVDLIVTSPPFPLIARKPYGNPGEREYADWFRPFARAFHRVLKTTGSLVLDLGGAWAPGLPVKSLYQYEVLMMLCRELGFYLAQDFYWWNPAKLPASPWVTRRRVRVKDAVDCVWWLSPSPWPRANNRRVLAPYKTAPRLRQSQPGRRRRPGGHCVSRRFSWENGGAIPPNLLVFANTDSNSGYFRYCRERHIAPHPARFPEAFPDFFIRFLTQPGDLVLDPFAGSCTAGAAAERLNRRWICVERIQDYLDGAMGRFFPKKGNTAENQRYSKRLVS